MGMIINAGMAQSKRQGAGISSLSSMQWEGFLARPCLACGEEKLVFEGYEWTAQMYEFVSAKLRMICMGCDVRYEMSARKWVW